LSGDWPVAEKRMNHKLISGEEDHRLRLRRGEAAANLQKATGLSIADATTLVEATPEVFLPLVDHPLWRVAPQPFEAAETGLQQPPAKAPRAHLGRDAAHTRQLLDSTRRRLAVLAAEMRRYGQKEWRDANTPASGSLNISSLLHALDQLAVARDKAANDLKLSDSGVRRGTCMVGGKAAAEAGAVTHGAVRCSAWLGVAVIWD